MKTNYIKPEAVAINVTSANILQASTGDGELLKGSGEGSHTADVTEQTSIAITNVWGEEW